MGLDQLRARLDRLLAADRRSRAASLRDALVELKVAAAQSRDALGAAERELTGQRQQLEDAERRGRLAADIADRETAGIAEQFAAKHRERISLLDRKIAVIRDELAYIEREYETVAGEYQSARQGPSSTPPPAALGADDADRELDALQARADREAIERAVQAQLDLLKKKLGKQ